MALTFMLMSARSSAEPYLAVQNGYKCVTCHVNPTGGGLRNDFGVIFARSLMPAQTLNGGDPIWSGRLTEFFRVGGDLRANWARNIAPNTPAQQKFSLDQFRLYADVAIIPDKLGLYIDEQVAPNSAENLEAYVRYGNPADGWYLKGGKFYLPFGWRLQDQTAFVREVSGISMTTPDNGLEIGWEKQHWSAQLDFTNGAANAQSGSGHQATAQVVYVQPRWRLGAAASLTQADAGNRQVFGVFAGLRTGPVAWLGEADVVKDQGFPEGERKLVSLLGEADWRILPGNNLKLTAEYFDPDRAVSEDQQTRWSALYEFTPIPFLQLRGGFRRYRGIPQSNSQNRRLLFFELHGFF
jgi:hypothetical protein